MGKFSLFFDETKEFDMNQQDLDDLIKSHNGSIIRAYESVSSLGSYYNMLF